MFNKIIQLIKNSENLPRANLITIFGYTTQTIADIAKAFSDTVKDEIEFEKRVRKRMNKSYED